MTSACAYLPKGQVPGLTEPDHLSDLQPFDISQNLPFPPPSDGSVHICHSLHSSVVPLSPALATGSLLPHAPVQGYHPHSSTGSALFPLMVDKPIPCLLQNALSSVLAKRYNYNRCVARRLGCPHGIPHDARHLDCSGNQGAHQHLGTLYGTQGIPRVLNSYLFFLYQTTPLRFTT